VVPKAAVREWVCLELVFWPRGICVLTLSRLLRQPVTILVPGAGLGRLAFEFAKRGFHCQGNEFSYFMLITSNYFLNRVERVDQFELFPNVHQFSNTWALEDQLRGVRIPDIIPQGLPQTADFSMTAGDFLEVYGGQRGILR